MSARPLRVLLVTDGMPERGGTETYAAAIRTGLRSAGVDVQLLTSSTGPSAHRAEFVAWSTERPAAQAVLQVVNPFAVSRVRTAVRAFHPDVALVLLFAYHLSPAVLFAFEDVPIVLSVVDFKIVCPLGSKLLPDGTICTAPAGMRCWRSGCLTLPHWLRDEVRYAAIRAALGRVRTMLACSRHMQQELRANGIESDVLRLPVAAPGPSFARDPADHPQFVYCGRLSREKGVSLLVRAFARLHARRPAARLRVVGDGALRTDLEQLARSLRLESAVTFTGYLEPGEVERQLADAWALVAPALWAEPLGLVSPEAIVRSVPVIASRTGGFSETVEEGRSGLLFRNGDLDDLYARLEQVAEGRAFPSHVLHGDVVASALGMFSIDEHVAGLRRHLEAACGRIGS